MSYVPTFGECLDVAASHGQQSKARGPWTDAIGFWPMQEGGGTIAYDMGGRQHDGTLTNGPTRTIGSRGQAIQFAKNVNDTIATTSYPAGNSEFSVFAWVQFADFGNHTCIASQYTSGTNGWELVVNNSRQIWFAHTNDWAVNNSSLTVALAAAKSWNLVGFGYSATNGTTIYRDTDTYTEGVGGAISVASPLYIGNRSDGSTSLDNSTFRCSGAMAFDRVLTPTEAIDLYAAGWDPGRRRARRSRAVSVGAPPVGGTVPWHLMIQVAA
jgi:hypothetical protein